MVNENWAINGVPFADFTEQLTKEWKEAGGIGFSLNVARDWLNIGLKATDADFAYYLELNGYSPEWVLNNGDEKDLRKKYRKFLKKQPRTKKPKMEAEKPRDLRNCEICNKHQFLTFKDYQRWHGKHKVDNSDPWKTVMTRPFSNHPHYGAYVEYKNICGECKGEKHKKDCSWYSDYQKKINQREQVKIKEQEEIIRKNELIEKIFEELNEQEINEVFNNNPDLMTEIQAKVKFKVANWYSEKRKHQELIKCVWQLYEKWQDERDLTSIKKVFEDNPQWKEAIY